MHRILWVWPPWTLTAYYVPGTVLNAGKIETNPEFAVTTSRVSVHIKCVVTAVLNEMIPILKPLTESPREGNFSRNSIITILQQELIAILFSHAEARIQPHIQNLSLLCTPPFTLHTLYISKFCWLHLRVVWNPTTATTLFRSLSFCCGHGHQCAGKWFTATSLGVGAGKPLRVAFAILQCKHSHHGRFQATYMSPTEHEGGKRETQ